MSSAYSNATGADEMRRRLILASERFAEITKSAPDLAQLVEERLAEMHGEIGIFSSLQSKEHDRDHEWQKRLYRSVSWGLACLTKRIRCTANRKRGASEMTNHDQLQPQQQMQMVYPRSVSRGPGRPSQDLPVVLRLSQLPPAEAMWGIPFCKLVASLTSFDLMVCNPRFLVTHYRSVSKPLLHA